MTKPEFASVVYDFRVRSRALRAAAAGLFSFLTLVTAFGVSSILQQAARRADYYERLPAQLPALVSLFDDDAGDVTIRLNPEVVRFVSALLEYASYPPWTATIGSLFLVVFLLQLLASLFRYMLRLASFYDARGDYFQLGGEIDRKAASDLLRLVDPTPVARSWQLPDLWRSYRGASAVDRSTGL